MFKENGKPIDFTPKKIGTISTPYVDRAPYQPIDEDEGDFRIVVDGTPLLDIKPYVKELDSKTDANYGWIDNLGPDKDHLLMHINGISHDY